MSIHNAQYSEAPPRSILSTARPVSISSPPLRIAVWALCISITILIGTSANADEAKLTELQTQIEELNAEQADLDAQLRQLVEQIQHLEIERDEMLLGRRELQERVRRLHAEQSALRIEAAGRPDEARDRRRLDELDTELAELRQGHDELRLEIGRGIETLNLEQNRVNGERAAVTRDPEYRQLEGIDRRHATLDLERRSLELDQQIRAARRELAVQHLEIARQARAVSIERFHLVIAMEQRRGRDDSVGRMQQGLSDLARESARKEMEEIFDEMLWEDEREILELRLQALDHVGDDPAHRTLWNRVRQLNDHTRNLRQLRESQRRQANLEQLQEDLARQIEKLEATSASATDDAAVLFEDEIQKLRDAVQELVQAL